MYLNEELGITKINRENRLIETRVVFESFATHFKHGWLVGLIETRVVFEFSLQLFVPLSTIRLIETRVVFEFWFR